VLEIVLDYPEAVKNIPRSMKDHGQVVLDVRQKDAKDWIILIRKEKE
jgi:TusA-related sulfurtransferase